MARPPFLAIDLAGAGGPRVEGIPAGRLGHVVEGTPRRPGGPPDGIFVEWRWNGSSLAIRNDRYGFRTFFYWCTATRFVASPSLTMVALHMDAPRVDPEALAVFLHLGYFVGEDTPLVGVRALPPACTLRWDGSLSLESSFALGVPNRAGIDEAREAYIELFRQSIARRPPRSPEFAIPVSGGKDSRHILLELLRQGHRPPECLSSRDLPPKASIDIEPAARLCERLGLRQVVVSPPPRFVAERRRTLRTSFCCDEHEWMVGLADHMNGRVSTTWDGISGDTLSAPRLQPPEQLRLFQSGRYEELAEARLERDVSRMASVLPESLRTADPRGAARARVAEQFRRLEGTANPLALFNVYNRGRREIAMMTGAMLSGVPTGYCPFLDHDLFDFLAGLPAEVRYAPDFHERTIATAYPEVADIPYAAKEGATVPAGRAFATFARQVAMYVTRRRPAWLLRSPALAGQWLTHGLSRARRSRERWLSPGRLLWMAMLEELCENPAAMVADLEREPALDLLDPAYPASPVLNPES